MGYLAGILDDHGAPNLGGGRTPHIHCMCGVTVTSEWGQDG